MKAGTVEHPKFRMLKAALQRPDYIIVGILESLWTVTAKWKDHGRIGEWSNQMIASAIDWDGNSDELIATLVETGWLDEHPEYRLVVHDWFDHCPTFVHDRWRKRGNSLKNKETSGNSWKIPDVPGKSLPTQPNPTQPSLNTPPSDDSAGKPAEREVLFDAEPKKSLNPATKKSATFTPPTQAEVDAEGKRTGLPPEECMKFLAHHEARGWNSKGSKIVDWKRAMVTWRMNFSKGQFNQPSSHSNGNGVTTNPNSAAFTWIAQQPKAKVQEWYSQFPENYSLPIGGQAFTDWAYRKFGGGK